MMPAGDLYPRIGANLREFADVSPLCFVQKRKFFGTGKNNAGDIASAKASDNAGVKAGDMAGVIASVQGEQERRERPVLCLVSADMAPEKRPAETLLGRETEDR